MVVPKEHVNSIDELSPSEYSEGMTLVRKVIDKAKQGLGADGVSVTLNMGEEAGQMVPHAYIQVFPRFEDEETSGTPTGAVFQPHEEAKKNIDSIQEKMSSVESDFGETTKEPHPDSQKFNSKGEDKQKKKDEKAQQNRSEKSRAGPLTDKPGPLSIAGSKPKKSSSSSSSGKSKDTETSDGDDEDRDTGDSGKEDREYDEDFEGKSFEWS